jgi:hypothetical protein
VSDQLHRLHGGRLSLRFIACSRPPAWPIRQDGHAARSADALLSLGDIEGHLLWQRVKRALTFIRSTERRSGEPIT